MKIYKKIFSVFISSIIAASAFSFHMQAEENYTVSVSYTHLDFKNAFAFEKCLHPKNPLYAESGLGWAHVSIR